jgi:DNA-binding MarR family transcriptional regulator
VNSPFEEITNLDRLVHEPARLAILTALDACRHADFMYLKSLTGLANGNLSQHLAKLEPAELISLTRGFEGKVPKTVVRLTPNGRSAVRAHWRRLEQTRKAASGWSGQWRRIAAEET